VHITLEIQQNDSPPGGVRCRMKYIRCSSTTAHVTDIALVISSSSNKIQINDGGGVVVGGGTKE